MAIATATCTCEKCSKRFEVRVTRRNRADANSFEEWAAENITVCPDCKQAEKDAAAEAAANKALAPYTLPALDGTPKQIAWAEKLRKSRLLAWLKELGEDVEESAIQWVLNRHADARWWIDHRDADTMSLLEEVAAEYQAEVLATDDEKAARAAEEQARLERIQRELDALGPIPAWPESVAEKWPKGATWNCKIYGGKGRKAIYLSGDKIALTDGEAEALEAALAARNEWRKRKAAIES